MSQRPIPCVIMRGGTSHGPYFHRRDLPTDPALLDRVLLRVMGSPDVRQIDGLGGATTLTSKVAIISPSEHPDADVDYLFAQVDVERELVDWGPTCGNLLAGVGPFALEEGLAAAVEGTTALVVRSVNTGSFIDVLVQTPGQQVTYRGDCVIAGAPGSAAPIELRFRQIMGAKTGEMLPTGNRVDVIDGVEVTCVDVAMPLVVARAEDLGLAGTEAAEVISGDRSMMERVERIRVRAGTAMGFDNVVESVVPKFAVISPPGRGGHFTSRYFTPWVCHTSYAVSGAIAAAAVAVLPGSVADSVVRSDGRLPELVEIEHPSGTVEIPLEIGFETGDLRVLSGGAVRTARRLMERRVYVPAAVWSDESE